MPPFIMDAVTPRRSGLNAIHTAAFGIATMIGAGWLTQTYNWWDKAGPFGAGLAFAVAGAALLPIALIYGRTSRSLARNELEWATESIPVWLAGAGGAAAVAAYALVVPWEGIQIAHIFGNLFHVDWLARVLAPLLCLLLLPIQYGGTRFNGQAQVFAVVTLLALICALTAIAVWTLTGTRATEMPVSGLNFSGFVAMVAVAPFYLAGFESGVRSIEDVNPLTRPRAAVSSPLTALAIGTAVYATIPITIAALPSCSRAHGAIAAADRLECMMPAGTARMLFAIVAAFSLLKCANGSLTASARGLWGASRSGFLPAALAAKTEAGVPGRAILAVTAFAVLLALAGPLVETPLAEGSSFGFVVSWEIIGIAYLIGSRRAGRHVGVAIGSSGVLLGLGFLAALFYSWSVGRDSLRPASGALVVSICALAGACRWWRT